jgi:hypothetical protein
VDAPIQNNYDGMFGGLESFNHYTTLVNTMALREGKYLASCRERSALSAAVNGHSAVYPSTPCTIAEGVAIFVREGKEVWRCNAAYAEANFRLERKD